MLRQSSRATIPGLTAEPLNHDHWNGHWAGREAPVTAEPHVRLEPEVAALARGRALDLACGRGGNAVWLALQGWQVTAVDFSHVAIEAAAELARAHAVEVAWVVADLLEYVPEPGAFDLVTVFFLQLPPGERNTVLERAAAAVAPGGTFLLAAHDRRNLAEGFMGPKDPDVLYGPGDVVPLLEGLAVERAETLPRLVETPQGKQTMVDAIVRARRPASPETGSR
jgi:SAM-dependent methyltransferase